MKGAVTKCRIEGKRKMQHLKPLKADLDSSPLCKVLNIVCILADSELQKGAKPWSWQESCGEQLKQVLCSADCPACIPALLACDDHLGLFSGGIGALACPVQSHHGWTAQAA